MYENRYGNKLADALQIRHGITAVIGSGGKTSTLRYLAEELSLSATVILTTSTKFMPFSGLPFLNTAEDPTMDFGPIIQKRLRENPILVVAHQLPSGKLATPGYPIEMMAKLADYVIVEADGARCLPLKAHDLEYEPVIPKGTRRTILVAGASGFHRPIYEVVHRPELFCDLVDAETSDIATPELVGRAIRKENLADLVFLNQVDTVSWDDVFAFRDSLGGIPFLAGALQSPTPVWNNGRLLD